MSGFLWNGSRLGRRRFLAVTGSMSVGLAGLGLVGCGGDDDDDASATGDASATALGVSPKPARGGELVVLTSTSPGGLDPMASVGSVDYPVMRAIFDNLVRRGDDFVPLPEWSLTEEWDVTNEGRELVLHLREGIVFHDGTPFNAEAAKWNLDKFIHPDTVTAEKQNVAAITGSTVVDEHTVSIQLSRPSASALAFLGDTPGAMVSPSAYERMGPADFRRSPVGTGPYKILEWVQDDHLTVVRNENYWMAERPLLDQIRWNFRRETAVLLPNLEAGAGDMVVDVQPTDVDRVRASRDLSTMDFTGSLVQMMYAHTGRAPFDNKFNRLAFNWAIDRAAILASVLRGQGELTGSPISSAVAWAFVQDPPGTPSRDLEAAKSYLANAGNPRGFSFVATTTPAYQQHLEAIQAQVSEIGIDMEISLLDGAAYLQSATSGESPAFYSGIPLRGDPHSISSAFGISGSFNPGHRADDVGQRLQSLLDQADSTYDLERRKEIYLELTKVANEEALYFPMWNTRRTVAFKSDVRGWSFGSEGAGRWQDVHRT